MRVNTIRHRAWLACRSPPGLSRWRGEQAGGAGGDQGDDELVEALDLAA
jgi:hypothetical protein